MNCKNNLKLIVPSECVWAFDLKKDPVLRGGTGSAF